MPNRGKDWLDEALESTSLSPQELYEIAQRNAQQEDSKGSNNLSKIF